MLQMLKRATHASRQEKVAKDPSVKAAVLISAKPDNFIAGADIRFIDTVEDFSTLKDGGWHCVRVCMGKWCMSSGGPNPPQ